MAARLNHPHILPLLDSGEVGDTLFYTMPLVEGESLRVKLDRVGQLSVDDPFLDNLRSLPRFQSLMERVKQEWDSFEV